jgi:hypothetical protein
VGGQVLRLAFWLSLSHGGCHAAGVSCLDLNPNATDVLTHRYALAEPNHSLTAGQSTLSHLAP